MINWTAPIGLLLVTISGAQPDARIDQAKYDRLMRTGVALRLALGDKDVTVHSFKELELALAAEVELAKGKAATPAERELVNDYANAANSAADLLKSLGSPGTEKKDSVVKLFMKLDAAHASADAEGVRKDLEKAEAIFHGKPVPPEKRAEAVVPAAPATTPNAAKGEAISESELRRRASRVYIEQDAEKVAQCKEIGPIHVTAPLGGGVVEIGNQKISYRSATELVRYKTVEAGGNAFLSQGLEMGDNDVSYSGIAYLCSQPY